MAIDCLIVSYSEPNRDRERYQFFSEKAKTGNGWGRFLHLNYVNYDNDIMLPNHLASIAKLRHNNGKIEKTSSGHFRASDINIFSVWRIPLLGGLYLYQYLKSLSFNVEIIQHVQMQQEAFSSFLREGVKVIAISTTLILNPLDIMELVKYCRRISPDSFIVLGGMGIWSNYLANKDNPSLFKAYRADAVVLDSKGFKTLGLIVNHIKKNKPLTKVPNLILYAKNSVEVTPKCPENFDFKKDAIKWDLINNNLLGQVSLVRTQISCPFRCSFCSYPATQGPFLQADMDTVERGLKILQKREVKYLLFLDDTFNVPQKRFKELLEILKKFDFYWYSFIRCQYLDEQQVKAMKESGCRGVYLGFESANDSILKAMNKRASNYDYNKGVALLASMGITTYGSFIIGFPGETEASIKDTKDFIEKSGIDFYNAKIFYYDHAAPISLSSSEFELTGQGMNWAHKTMTSLQAFTKVEELIMSIKDVPYIPQHSGEIWEIAHLHERGFSREDIHILYKNFTKMLQDELSSSPSKLVNQDRLFKELVNCYGGDSHGPR